MGDMRVNPRGDLLCRARRGQRGSILLFVLAVLLMLTIAVLGVLNMSLNTTKVALNLEGSTNMAHRVDGSLEAAINEIREITDPNSADPVTGSGGLSVDCFTSGPQPFGDFEVECRRIDRDPADDLIDPSVWGTPHRTVDLRATDPNNGDALVGRARVQVTDQDGGSPLVGYTVEVCDWLLIQALSNEMQGCPT